MTMAEQIHDALAKHRFRPFIDRFDILAVDVQERIHEALDDAAFVLVLESDRSPPRRGCWRRSISPSADTRHPGPLPPRRSADPGTQDSPRIRLDDSDLHLGGTGPLLRDAPANELVNRVETIHAQSLVRLRTRLVAHTRKAAERTDFAVNEEPGPRLAARPADPDDQRPPAALISPNLPRPDDLRRLDRDRSGTGSGLGGAPGPRRRGPADRPPGPAQLVRGRPACSVFRADHRSPTTGLASEPVNGLEL